MGAHIEGIEPRLKLNRVSISPITGAASSVVIRLLSKKQVDMAREKLVQGGYAAEGHLRNFMATKLILAAVVGGYGYIVLQFTDLRSAALILCLAFHRAWILLAQRVAGPEN